jgi:hypothetical protein
LKRFGRLVGFVSQQLAERSCDLISATSAIRDRASECSFVRETKKKSASPVGEKVALSERRGQKTPSPVVEGDYNDTYQICVERNFRT